jgi:hypothetical protein
MEDGRRKMEDGRWKMEDGSSANKQATGFNGEILRELAIANSAILL